MPINSRSKGAVGERELVQRLNDSGMMARRTAQYCGNTGDAADIAVDGLTLHVEVKRCERLPWKRTLAQVERDSKSNGGRWIIAHRQNGMRTWLIVQTLEQWVDDSIAAQRARAHRTEVMRKAIDGTIPTHSEPSPPGEV
jgi:Holliday junction resolvase